MSEVKKSVQKIDSFKTTDGKIFEDEREATKHQEAINKYEAGRFVLPWEYCECGCKGFKLKFLERYFWSYVALGEKDRPDNWFLGEGHGYAFSKQIAAGMKTARDVDLALLPTLIKYVIDAEEFLVLAKETIAKLEEYGNGMSKAPK